MKLNNPAALSALVRGDVANALVAATPGGIEAQEAAGQASMVARSQLPKDGLDRAKVEAMGIRILGDADDLFVSVSLPDGWQLKPTDHSMWSDLIDAKARVRAFIFYKAAFYDRNAHMRLAIRYRAEHLPCDEAGTVQKNLRYGEYTHMATVVTDGGMPIHTVGILEEKPRDPAYYPTLDEHSKAAEAWLAERFPDWRDPSAYWD